MNAPRWAFLRGLGARTLLTAVLPTVAILVGIIVYTTVSLSREVRSEAERSLQNLAETVAGEVERANSRAVMAARVMAHAQEGGNLFGRREASVAFARQVLAVNPDFTGAYFGYEPDADGRDADFVDVSDERLADAHDDAGRFLPYWFRGHQDSRRLLLEPLVAMESSLYYQGCKELFLEKGAGHSMVTEPYVYEGKMIVEHTHPIVVDGRFAGIAGVDRALTDIDAFIEEIKERSGVDVFLVSRLGAFVATTTPQEQELVTRGIDSTLYADLFGNLLADRTAAGLALDEDPADGRPYYYATQPVPTGEWTVVVRKLEADVMAPIRHGLLVDLVIATLGLAVVVALSLWTMRSVSGRLEQAVQAADTVASGSLGAGARLAVVPVDEAGDEVDALMRSLRRMVESLEAKMVVVDAISRGDYARQVEVTSDDDALGQALRALQANLRTVALHAGRLAEGDYGQHLEPQSEVDELVPALNRMTQSLADARDQLEQRVQQRTEELNQYTGQLELRTRELQALSEKSQAQVERESSLATLTARLQGDLELEAVAQRALDAIVEFIGAPAGAIYTPELDGRLHRQATHALPPESSTTSFALGSGSVGQVAASRTVSVNRPPDESFSLAFGLLRVTPRRILTLPLVANEALAGVMELYLEADLDEERSEWLTKATDITAVSLRLATESREREVAEEQTRLILESSGEAIFGLDTEGRATFVNPVACDLLGYAAEELIGQPAHGIIHHSHADGSPYPVDECPMRRAFTEGVVTRVDDEVLWRKDGSAVHVEYASTPILKEGEIHGAVISIRDITERRAAQKRLQAREEQFRTLLDSAPDAMVISDSDGVITMVNRQTESLFGWTRDELLGRTVEVLMPERFRHGHPDQRQAFLTDHSSRSMGVGMELRAVTKGGREFPIEVSLSPIQTEEGLMVASALRDVSERHESEALVRLNQERMAALFEALPVGVVMIDPSGKIAQANGLTESILGLSADEHTMRDLQSQEWTIVREDGSPMPVEEYPASRAMSGEGEVRDVVMGVHRPQGDVVWISTSAAPIEADAGGGVAVAFEDITERRARQRQEALLSRIRGAVWQLDSASQTGDLLELLGIVLRDSGIPCDAFGVNVVEDAEAQRVRSFTLEASGEIRDVILPPGAARTVLDMWQQGQIVHRPDLRQDDPFGELRRWPAEETAPATIIDVPFSHGTFAANSGEARAFVDQIGMLEAVAEVLSEGFRRLDDLHRTRS